MTVLVKKMLKSLPEGLKSPLRKSYKNYVWKRAIKQFKHKLEDIEKHPELINDLIYGWGNQGWSAFHDYTLALITEAKKNKGPVLECGSGLSTILLGLIAQQKGFKVYTLEHIEKWGNKVKYELNNLGINSVYVSINELENFGEYEWYNPDSIVFEQTFDLVICDGPPSKTKGGRYGMLPNMVKRLNDNAVILMDDFNREEERQIVKKWCNEHTIKVEEGGERDLYARLLLMKKTKVH